MISSSRDADPVATSPLRAVAHRPTQTQVVLWIEARAATTGWRVEVSARARRSGGDSTVCWQSDLSSDPRFKPTAPVRRQRRYRVWHETVHGLEPGRWYSVSARSDKGRVVELATFRTIPAALPFTVVVASCYAVESDASGPWAGILGSVVGRILPLPSQLMSRLLGTTIQASRTDGLSTSRPGLVSQRYLQQCRQLGERAADLKLLLGDQVYIDAPFRAFVLRRLKDSWIERHISHVYHRSWDRLGGFLTTGANVCTSDDHEFWNDFPNRPGLPWPRLRSVRPESTMREHAQRYRAEMQLAEPRWPFHIGDAESPRISFLSVDTRVNRTPMYALADEKPPQFMEQGDLDEVCRWITNLRAPGVLALGQPLLSRPMKLTVGSVVADVNLPAYGAQYSQLCRALTAARCDVMVLAGDVHFGRVAQIQLVREGRAGARIVEVVSSPLALLRGAGSTFPLPAPAELCRFPHPWMPEFPHLADGADIGSVSYLMTIPRPEDGQGRPSISEGPESDHYMTVRFEDRADGDIDATVYAYLIRRPRTEGPPELAWHKTFVLRTAEHIDAEHDRSTR